VFVDRNNVYSEFRVGRSLDRTKIARLNDESNQTKPFRFIGRFGPVRDAARLIAIPNEHRTRESAPIIDRPNVSESQTSVTRVIRTVSSSSFAAPREFVCQCVSVWAPSIPRDHNA